MLRELRLSASANADYQACQKRYWLSYIADLTADKDKDSLRVGGNWHRCHELLELKAEAVCPDCLRHEEIRPDCYICAGTGYTPADPMEAVVRYLNYAYAVVPDNKTRDDWETERVTLLYSLSGHRWLYKEDEDRWETIGSEIKFEVPVINPVTGRKLGKAVFVGKIDRLVRERNTGLVYVWERKSTSHPITSESYWHDLAQGDQISGYLYGGRVAQANGQLRKHGIRSEDPPIAGAWCDVWHKPDIAPKRVSKADLKTLAETGMYCGTKAQYPQVNPAVVGESIVETPELFGARLLQDIAERPDHYFAQREVARTDRELEQFQWRLFKLAKQIRAVEKNDLWLCNLRSCEQPFYCEYRDLCRSGVAGTIDSEPPVGYKRKHPKEEEVPLE